VTGRQFTPHGRSHRQHLAAWRPPAAAQGLTRDDMCWAMRSTSIAGRVEPETRGRGDGAAPLGFKALVARANRSRRYAILFLSKANTALNPVTQLLGAVASCLSRRRREDRKTLASKAGIRTGKFAEPRRFACPSAVRRCPSRHEDSPRFAVGARSPAFSSQSIQSDA
jgi:hypothetical protein